MLLNNIDVGTLKKLESYYRSEGEDSMAKLVRSIIDIYENQKDLDRRLEKQKKKGIF